MYHGICYKPFIEGEFPRCYFVFWIQITHNSIRSLCKRLLSIFKFHDKQYNYGNTEKLFCAGFIPRLHHFSFSLCITRKIWEPGNEIAFFRRLTSISRSTNPLCFGQCTLSMVRASWIKSRSAKQ